MPKCITASKMPAPERIKNLPQDLRDMTNSQWKAWVRWEAQAFNYRQLRHRQSVVQSQLRRAGIRRRTESDSAAAGRSNLIIHDEIIAAAIGLQAFGDDEAWRTHSVMFGRLRAEQTTVVIGA